MQDVDRTGRATPGGPVGLPPDRSTAATLCGRTAREVARFGRKPTSIARDPGRPGRAGLEPQSPPRPRVVAPPEPGELVEPTAREAEQIRQVMRSHRGG